VHHYQGDLGHPQIRFVAELQIAVECAIRAETDMIALMMLNGAISMILEMNITPAVATTTGPLDHRHHDHSAAETAGSVQETGHRRDLSDVIDADRDLLMAETDGLEVLVLEDGRGMMARLSSHSLAVHREMCPTYRF
jgi:hypothetical protein